MREFYAPFFSFGGSSTKGVRWTAGEKEGLQGLPEDHRFQIRIQSPAMALFRRKFRLTACATTGG
jgi:hypothetical protein